MKGILRCLKALASPKLIIWYKYNNKVWCAFYSCDFVWADQKGGAIAIVLPVWLLRREFLLSSLDPRCFIDDV